MKDEELKKRFDGIDARFEVVDERFDAVDERFDAVDERFDAVDERFNAVDERFNAVDERFNAVDERFNAVDERFNGVDARFNGVDAWFAELRDLIVHEGQRTRKHFDVVAEGLEDRIKLLAEGHSAVSSDVADLKDGQQRLEAGQGQLDIRMLALESRVLGVEKVQKIVLTEVRGLAGKVDRLAPRGRISRRR